MSLKGKKVYVRRPLRGRIYKWAPQTSITDTKPKVRLNAKFCDAQAYSTNGEDSITKYVTKKEVIDGTIKHYAYVACNYVQ